MDRMLKIKYRDFYDVPRMFFVDYEGDSFLFGARFDDEQDEYSNYFEVYLMPKLSSEELEGSWENIYCIRNRYGGKCKIGKN